MFKGNSTPEPNWSELPWMLGRHVGQAARTNAKADNHCIVCGALICPGSTWCTKCQPRALRAKALEGNTANYSRKLYSAVLTMSLRRAMDIPVRVCPFWGTPQCLECDYEIPWYCPALDGQPEMSCDKCTLPCRCNGTLP